MRTARRSQIIEAAIDTIAVEGLAGTSFAKIAKSAGLSSTGLISYHFANKRELMDEVVRVVGEEVAELADWRMREADGPAEQLRAYLAANIEYAAKHHTRLRAARAIGLPEPDDRLPGLLRAGQRYGEFRFFDVDLMTLAIRSVRDGVLERLAVGSAPADLDAYTDELATIFELATRGT
ncbi:MAG TPA: TetR family transcriptional regulator [Actinophytocola sp.]|jgi:AcrR family transcriptional regulator|uniref:TetR/AcrR family transcriptional regulator n=1 Tax=Actinophytocola sp. TaxID=1872138 RepID=UPI002F943B91